MLRFDPAIRYVMLIGEDDKPLSSVSRRSDKSALEPPGQGNLVLRRFAIARGMASTSDSFYGPARFVILLREKLIEIVYLSAANMILVGADPRFPPREGQATCQGLGQGSNQESGNSEVLTGTRKSPRFVCREQGLSRHRQATHPDTSALARGCWRDGSISLGSYV